MKQRISGQFDISFTTEQFDRLPTMYALTDRLQDLFAGVLEAYLNHLDVDYEEVDKVIVGKLTCEETEEE